MSDVRRKYDEEKLKLDKELNGGEYRQCAISLMDTIRTQIEFDRDGISHFYRRYVDGAKRSIKEGEEGAKAVERALSQM